MGHHLESTYLRTLIFNLAPKNISAIRIMIHTNDITQWYIWHAGKAIDLYDIRVYFLLPTSDLLGSGAVFSCFKLRLKWQLLCISRGVLGPRNMWLKPWVTCWHCGCGQWWLQDAIAQSTPRHGIIHWLSEKFPGNLWGCRAIALNKNGKAYCVIATHSQTINTHGSTFRLPHSNLCFIVHLPQ